MRWKEAAFFPGIVLLLWAVFYAFLQIRWIQIDTRPPAWDEAHHLRIAHAYGEELFHGKWSALFAPHDLNYPPLYHWTLAVTLRLFNGIPDSAAYLNILYALFLMASLFFLIRSLQEEENADKNSAIWSGVLGAVLGSACPFVFYIAHFALIDTALMAWAAFVLLCLVKCRNFSDRKWTILLGIGWACGMMTKWSFFSYVLFPTLWLAVKTLPEHRKNIRYSALIVLILIIPWYAPNLFYVFRRMFLSGHGELSDPSITTLSAWLWYGDHLPDLMGVVGTILFLIGLADILRTKNWFLAGTILFPYLFWTITRNKDLRYFLPVVPVMAVAAVQWMRGSGILKKASLIVLCGFQLCYAGFTSHGTIGLNAGHIKIPFFGAMDSLPPMHEDWKQKEILSIIREFQKNQDSIAILRTTSYTPYLSNISLRYGAIQGQVYDRIKPLGNPPYEDFFSFTDFVLDQTGGWDSSLSEFQNHQELNAASWFSKSFKEISRWHLPEGYGDAVLYVLDPEPVKLFNLEELSDKIANVSLDPDLKYERCMVQIIPINPEQSQRGHFKKIRIQTIGTYFRELGLGDVTAEVEEVWINLPLLKEKNILRLFRMKQLIPSVHIQTETLQKFLEAKAGQYLSSPKIDLENGRITISADTRYGVKAETVFHLSLGRDDQGPYVLQEVEKIKVGRVTIPRFVYRVFTDRKHYLNANPGMPFDLVITQFEIDHGLLKIN